MNNPENFNHLIRQTPEDWKRGKALAGASIEAEDYIERPLIELESQEKNLLNILSMAKESKVSLGKLKDKYGEFLENESKHYGDKEFKSEDLLKTIPSLDNFIEEIEGELAAVREEKKKVAKQVLN